MENTSNPLEESMIFRNEVLRASLLVEHITSIFIAELLGIKDSASTKTLGNKSSALSFNQKVDLLIDLGALGTEDKKKYQAFMGLRNQFMHNMNALNYETCYSYMEGTDKWLLKMYPQDTALGLEDKLRKASLSLVEDVVMMTSNIIHTVVERNEKRIEAKLHRRRVDRYRKVLTGINNKVDKILNDDLVVGQVITEDLRNKINDLLFFNMADIWGDLFEENGASE